MEKGTHRLLVEVDLFLAEDTPASLVLMNLVAPESAPGKRYLFTLDGFPRYRTGGIRISRIVSDIPNELGLHQCEACGHTNPPWMPEADRKEPR